MSDLISVIIATYNGDRYLAEAIESVLAQESVNFEIVIVDDGSTDNTAGIIKRYSSPKLTAIWQENQGQAAACNRGLTLAQGNFIAFLDHDDIYVPNKLSLQLNFLKKMPEIDMVFGYVEQFISPELPDDIKAKRECPKNPMPGYLPSIAMLRKECFEKVGHFNTKWHIGSSIDWGIRAKEKGLKDFCLPEIVVRRRIHDRNQTITSRSHYNDYINVIKDKLERSRHSLSCDNG